MNVKLDELCNFINGGAWSDKEYVANGIPVLKVSNLKSDGIDFTSVNYIAETSLVKYSKHLLEKDDLVIATVGSHPSLVNSAAGRSTIITSLGEGYLLNQNAVLIRTRDKNILNQKYLSYLGKTSHFQHYIQQRGKGAANQMRIAIGAIKEFEVQLPRIDRQREIASILSYYDDLIENNLRRIKLIEELAERTYDEWFVKFRVNGVQLELGENGLPHGWAFKSMTNSPYFLPCKSKVKAFEGEMEYLATADIEGIFIVSKGEQVQWKNKPSRAQIYPPEESVWFARMSSTYKVLLLTNNYKRKFLLSSGFVGFTPSQKLYLPFLYCTINSKKFHWLKDLYSTGATQVSLTDKGLQSIETIVPSVDIINRFGENYMPILELRQNLICQNYFLKESRDILLPRLMSGELDVEVAEKELKVKVVPIQKEKTKDVSKEFKEAVLISVLTEKFGSEKYPLGRMRYTKLSYLFHRYADNEIADYLRKAAGPYNPKTKYAGPEKIAHDNGYVIDHQNGSLKGFVAGKNIAAAKTYFDDYWSSDYLNWLESQFKYKSNDELELYATIDSTMIELCKNDLAITVANVKEIIKKEPEWKAKLERDIFSDGNIGRAINFLPTIFNY